MSLEQGLSALTNTLRLKTTRLMCLFAQPYCWWLQTQLGFTVLTNGTVGFAWIWAGYSAAGSNLQDIFFYCKWLCLFSCKQLFFCCLFGFSGVFFVLFCRGGCFCHPYTLPSAIPTPRASPPFAATREWCLCRHFPTCWHLFTWVCANCTLSCCSRWIFIV